ncbi:MAG: hypothetical protein Q4A92_08720 [Corynebacterium sp.]|nr:hypothetical protein [Corynebacterium sp.]
MSGGLVIGLIVAVWLFVLAPLVLRSQKPISRAGEAFDDTRVVYEGGSGDLVQPRRPRPVRREEPEEIADVDPQETEIVFEDEPSPAKNLIAAVTQKLERPKSEEVPEVIEFPVAEIDEDEAYDYSDAYISPGDMLHPAADEDEPIDEFDESEALAAEEQEFELTDEDREFAERRRGRGGYDPVADAANRSTRYQRRQRTFMILLAALVVTLIIGTIVGGMAWLAPSIAGGLLCIYLFVLRQQVRAENELRDRRIRQLRRARLGVRNAQDEELGIPARLRRPGAVVLEVDDESPDFEYLGYAHGSDYYQDDDYVERSPRRVS